MSSLVAKHCKSRTKTGKPCKAAPMEGGLCFFHANPDKASELGRLGGRHNRGAIGPSTDSVLKLDGPLAVRDAVAELIEEVRRGDLPPHRVSALTSLLSLYLRACEATKVQQGPQQINYSAGRSMREEIEVMLGGESKVREHETREQAKALLTA